MLEIKPIDNKEIQKDLCEKAGIEYIEESFAYKAFENDKYIGISQFNIYEGYALIYNIKEAINIQDFEAMFILGRAVLNFIDLCHVTYAKINNNAASERLITAIGFKKDADGYLPLCLTNMFRSKCESHK